MRIALLSRGTAHGLKWGLEECGAQVQDLNQAEAGLLSIERRPGSPMIKVRMKQNRHGQEVIRSFQTSEAELRQLPGWSRSAEAYASRESLAKAVEGADHVLLCKGSFLSHEDIGWLAERCPLTYLMWDTVTCGPAGRVEAHGERGALCRSVIATGAEAVRWYRARRPGQPVAQIFQGFRPHVWSPKEPTPAPRRAIVFTGAFYPGDGGREQKLDALRRLRVEVRHFNHHQNVFFEKAAAEYRRQAITLNFVPQQSPGSFSNRVVRVMAAGGFMFSEWCEDLARVFRDGEELVLFRDQREMLVKVQEYLYDEPRRLAVQRAGTERVQEFRWDRQAEKYLRFLRGESIQDDGAQRCTSSAPRTVGTLATI